MLKVMRISRRKAPDKNENQRVTKLIERRCTDSFAFKSQRCIPAIRLSLIMNGVSKAENAMKNSKPWFIRKMP